MKTLIFCGGRGIVDPVSRQRIPKGMVQIGDRPLLWHVMKSLAAYGHTDFILALGVGARSIHDYFVNGRTTDRTVRVDFSTGDVTPLTSAPEDNWTVTLVPTGQKAETGARLSRCRPYLGQERFLMTYSDCLANVAIDALEEFHRRRGKTLTVTGVQPTWRFGVFNSRGGEIVGYTPTAHLMSQFGFINGGYMIAEPAIFEHVEPFAECSLECDAFPRLAEAQQIAVYQHDGFWQAVDAERDIEALNAIYWQNRRPWLRDDIERCS
jgi:glucose-1-phosphate cytidylyltransferase